MQKYCRKVNPLVGRNNVTERHIKMADGIRICIDIRRTSRSPKNVSFLSWEAGMMLTMQCLMQPPIEKAA